MPYLLPSGQIGLRIEGSGPLVVLLHSSMSSKSQWRELTESLRNRYRVIAIDLIGYGESAMPSSGDRYRLRDEVRLVESVLARHLRLGEPFHLVGHSYGGMVALQLAAQARSQLVRSLSLFEPIAFHLLPSADPDLEEMEEVRREMESRLSAGDAHGAAGCFVDYWSGAGSFAQLREERQALLAAQVPKILLEYRTVAEESRHPAAYRRIEVPTCLVTGSLSPEPAQRLISILAELMPHASCVEVAAGHMAPITHPALVNPIFEKFIRDVDASEERSTAAVERGRGWSRAVAVGLSGIVFTVVLFAASHARAQQQSGMSTRSVYPLEASAWHDAPPGMPPGGRFAVISGDPLEAGPFVMRVWLPPGYRLPPYRRRNEAEMIVLAGTITVGEGVSGAANERTLTSGSYASLAANEIHHAHTKNGAIVQIVGIGPFEMM